MHQPETTIKTGSILPRNEKNEEGCLRCSSPPKIIYEQKKKNRAKLIRTSLLLKNLVLK